MKKWFEQNKVILISFLVISFILCLTIPIMLDIITQPDALKELNEYMQTNEITTSLKKYAFMAFLNILIFAVWSLLFAAIIWKVFFPTKKSAQEAFSIDSFKFLYHMPSQLKKEWKKDE